jgi:hydroxymethylbilane synthase
MASRPVRVGTRGSALSLWQTRWVVERLERALPGRAFEIIAVTTRGDELTGPLPSAGDVGLFTSALERALVDGRVDMAVHSLKDLPVSAPGALPVVAVPLRGDPADAVVSREGLALADLPPGSTVGTSSPRRECLVRSLRPDVRVAPLRGNVDGRVRQLDEGGFDAIILAVAGLERLGLGGRITERLDPKGFPPAPGQGALAVQASEKDAGTHAAVRALDDAEARAATSAERACLEAIGGGCSRPIGVHAWQSGAALAVAACVGSLDGGRLVRVDASGAVHDAEGVGRAAARALLESGAGELLS